MNRSGLLASLVAAHRPSERNSVRRYKEVTALLSEIGPGPTATSADVQEHYVEAIVTFHRDAMSPWDWQQIRNVFPPPAGHEREAEARRSLDSYKPSFFEGLFGRARARVKELEAAVGRARADDEVAWHAVVEQWTWLQEVARGVVRGELRAYQAAIEHLCPFEELESLGAKVTVSFSEPSLGEAFVTVRDDAVPLVEHTVLASGRRSVKNMPKTRRLELCQAHVCSSAIRVARELFALLPIARTFVHVGVVQLNPATGHTEPHTLLSVEFDRERLLSSNFDKLDPAFAIESFRHAMNFKRTAGLLPVDRLEALAQLTALAPETPAGRRR